MTANSEIILSANTHPGDSTVTTVTGTKFKGDGYYGRSDGFHSVQYTYDGLTGTVTIQGTLAIDPAEDDWFDVHTYTAAQETSSAIASFSFSPGFCQLPQILGLSKGGVQRPRI